MSLFWFACTSERHREPRVIGLGVEIRGEVDLNNLRPYVRFYLECKKCGARGDKLREAQKTYIRPNDLILSGVYWDTEKSGEA